MTFRCGRFASCSLLLIVLSAPVGLRAEPEEEPPDPDLSTKGMGRLGPVLVQPYLHLRDVGYDDNVLLSGDDPQGDYTATIAPGFKLLMLMRDRGGIHLDQEFRYVAYREWSELSHWDGSTRLRGIALVDPVILSLEDLYTLSLERPNSEFNRRVRTERNAVTAEVRSNTAGRLGFRGYAGRERFRFDRGEPGTATAARLLDRDERVAALIGELRALPKTTVTLESRYELADFESETEGRDTRAWSVLPGLRFDPTAFIQGELSIGVMRLRASERPQSDYNGFVAGASLSARISYFGRARVRLERDLTFSSTVENLYFIGTSWSAGYQHYFSRRLSAGLAYGRGLNHYPEEVVRAGSQPFQGIRDDRITTYETGFGYRLAEDRAITVSAKRFIRDSTDDLQDRERTLYAIGTSLVF